ncbi:hypothetical protein [Streptomyces sp. NPDC058086]|uniref:hypothetical protein n=1 Tax=Streptomyces sp. NPDC058086 TaxID=3346334 RepID=UPI0036E0F996
MKRTVLAASEFSVALLAGPAGCASGDSDAADEPTPKASRAKEPGPARRPATQMITAADLGQGYSVRDFSVAKEKSAFAETPDRITVDRGPCHPLATVMNQLPLGRPQAFLTRVVSPEKSVGTPAEETTGTPAEETTGAATEESTAVTYVTLAAYDRGMATAAMDTLLARGVDSCRLGFTARAVNGTTRTYPSVAVEEAGTAGDEALAYKAATTVDGVTRTVRTTVVRSGDVIAVYVAVDGTARVDGEPRGPRVPAVVLTAQNAKLG